MRVLAFALLFFALQVSLASTCLVAQSAAPSFESTSKSQTADTSGNRSGEPTQTVKISELPPLLIAKDWSDRAYWLFTLFLAVIGGLQVFLALHNNLTKGAF